MSHFPYYGHFITCLMLEYGGRGMSLGSLYGEGEEIGHHDLRARSGKKPCDISTGQAAATWEIAGYCPVSKRPTRPLFEPLVIMSLQVLYPTDRCRLFHTAHLQQTLNRLPPCIWPLLYPNLSEWPWSSQMHKKYKHFLWNYLMFKLLIASSACWMLFSSHLAKSL